MYKSCNPSFVRSNTLPRITPLGVTMVFSEDPPQHSGISGHLFVVIRITTRFLYDVLNTACVAANLRIRLPQILHQNTFVKGDFIRSMAVFREARARCTLRHLRAFNVYPALCAATSPQGSGGGPFGNLFFGGVK